MDHYYLQLAYHLALQNEGCTSPNPSVGAVVVQGDRITGAAFHPKAGEPHAEVLALKQAGARAAGATLYCSLEPCAHQGKTPPCVDEIIRCGVSRVVFGAVDQNPLVNGRGIQILRERGLKVDRIILPHVEDFYEPIFRTFQTGRPYIYAKVAMTVNGIISPADRNSRWITNETSLAWVHQLRARCDAVLVGADTVILDRPHLTVRAPVVKRNPLRIILDNRFKLTPDDCSLLDSDAPVLVCGSDHAPPGKESVWENTPVKTMRYHEPASLLSQLMEIGIRKIVVEGGQKIFTFFHTEGFVDEYVLMVAPRLLTGQHFLNMLGGPDQSLSETSRYRMLPLMEFDGDAVIRLRKQEC